MMRERIWQFLGSQAFDWSIVAIVAALALYVFTVNL